MNNIIINNATLIKSKNTNRYSVIDILRALTIISMIFYHASWDIIYMFGVRFMDLYSPIGILWQQSICFSFIILSGFCWSFGNNQLKNGVSVIFWSFVVSIVSIIIDQPIYFGVLTCIGSCILITLLCNKFLKKINPIIGMLVCLALFLFTREVKSGYFGFYSVKLFDAPSFLYKDFVTAYFGFPPLKFASFDYYPILPWIFLYWFGYFLYYLFKKYNWFKVLSKISFKPLEIIGRKSLHIYVVHQVVIFALLYVLFLFIR